MFVAISLGNIEFLVLLKNIVPFLIAMLITLVLVTESVV
jgi:TRAP-type C4-dicarboxylate transport system permease large subunit